MNTNYSMNILEQLNQYLFLLINADVNTPAWLIKLAEICAGKLVFIIPLLLLALWFWGNRNDRSLALKSCAVLGVAMIFSYFIGIIYAHPRPFMINLGHTFLQHKADTSFPSDHMTFVSAFFITFLYDRQRFFGLLLLVIGLLTAWGRVYLGVHFPFDMLGALVVAGLAYSIVRIIWRRLGDIIVDLCESLYRRIFAPLIAKKWISN